MHFYLLKYMLNKSNSSFIPFIIIPYQMRPYPQTNGIGSAWLKIPSKNYPQFLPVRVLDKITTNTALVIEEEKLSYLTSQSEISKQSYTVPDDQLLPKSENQINDFAKMEFCNPPQLIRFMKEPIKQGGCSFMKIGNQCLIDTEPNRSIKYCTPEDILFVQKFYRHHLQSLLGSKRVNSKSILIAGKTPHAHQYVFPLFSYLKSNKDMWPYKIDISKLELIMSRFLGGTFIEIKLGYMMKNQVLRKTQYLHFKPYRIGVPTTLGIPNFIINLMNNEQCSSNFHAPKPKKNKVSNQQIKQMIDCLFGVGFTAVEISKLMKMLACIANLRGLGIKMEESQGYRTYRFVDNEQDQQKRKDSECMFRFKILSGLDEAVFRDLILSQTREWIQESDLDALGMAEVRLRVLEYLFYEKFVEYLCLILNKKFCTAPAAEQIHGQIAGHKKSKQITHKSLVILSVHKCEEQEISAHSKMETLRYCQNGIQSIYETLQGVFKANLLKTISKNELSSHRYSDSSKDSVITLNDFINVNDRLRILHDLSSSKGQLWMDQNSFKKQSQMHQAYRSIKSLDILEQIMENIMGEKETPESMEQIPQLIKNALWENTNMSVQILDGLLQKSAVSEVYSHQHELSYASILSKKEQDDSSVSDLAFIVPNKLLLQDFFFLEELSDGLNIRQNLPEVGRNESLEMELLNFADRYKYTNHLKKDIHQKHSSMSAFVKNFKKSEKKPKSYYYTFYEDNTIANEELGKKIQAYYLEEGPSEYRVASDPWTPYRGTSKSFMVIINNLQFFDQLQDEVEKQHLAKWKIWKQYLTHKHRKKTNEIVNKNQRLKKLPKVLGKTFGKKYFFDTIRKYVICKSLRRGLKKQVYGERLSPIFEVMIKYKSPSFLEKLKNSENKPRESSPAQRPDSTSSKKPLQNDPVSDPSKNANRPVQSSNSPNYSNQSQPDGSPNKPVYVANQGPSDPHSKPTSSNTFQSNPGTTSAKPSAFQNKPTTNKPTITTAATTTNKPGTTTATTTTNKPGTTTATTTTNKPGTTTANKPATTTTNKPANTITNKPSATTQDKPAVTTSQNNPATTANKPTATVNNQATTQNKPVQITSNNPVSTSQNKPATSQNNPATSQNNPATSQNNPATSQNNPAQNKPIDTVNKPASTSQNNPATSNNPTTISTLPKTQANNNPLQTKRELNKKSEKITELTKPELESIQDQPTYSLDAWEQFYKIKGQKTGEKTKQIQERHRPLNSEQVPEAEQEDFAVEPDKKIQELIKMNDYIDFLRKNALYDQNKQGNFESVIQCQSGQLGQPILRQYPTKNYASAWKQSFNALLKIGQHKNSSKPLQFLLNQIISPLNKSYTDQIHLHKNSSNGDLIVVYDYTSQYNIMKDEILLQFSKQLTQNKNNSSVTRLLHGLSVITRHYAPSYLLIYAYLNHLERMTPILLNKDDPKDATFKARSSLLEAVQQNLLIFVEVYEKTKNNKVAGLKSSKKILQKDLNEAKEYLVPRTKLFQPAEINVGNDKSAMTQSVTPSKMDFSALNHGEKLIRSHPDQCCIRLLNNYPFAEFVRNESVRTIKKRVLDKIGFLNKEICFGLFIFKKGNLYHIIDDHLKMIDYVINEKGEDYVIYLRIKFYFPFSLKQPNITRLTHMNLISQEITQPWDHKTYEWLVVQSMLYGEFEELRVNNYLHFSNQIGIAEPNMESIKELFTNISANSNTKLYAPEYMKFMKEHRMFMIQCYRKKTDPSFRIGVKPYEIVIFSEVKQIASIQMKRIQSLYIEGDSVVLQLNYGDYNNKNIPLVRRKLTVDHLFRPHELYDNILHHIRSTIVP